MHQLRGQVDYLQLTGVQLALVKVRLQRRVDDLERRHLWIVSHHAHTEPLYSWRHLSEVSRA